MAKATFEEIGQLISRNKVSNMFGVPCFKIGRKPFILLYEDEIVCKLYDEAHAEAIELDGASLFCPKKGAKPMQNWVQLPFEQADKWHYFAELAYGFV